MRKQTLLSALLMIMLTTFSSCAVVGGIFKAGMGVGIFAVVLVLAIIIYFVTRMAKNE